MGYNSLAGEAFDVLRVALHIEQEPPTVRVIDARPRRRRITGEVKP